MADRPDTEAKDPKMFAGRPFPWEPSIENQKPMDMFSKAVGDFLFFNVLTNGNIEEIRSRGVQFEIEAKLGTIIDKSTNDRIYLPVRVGECVMGDEARIAFRSSMTEVSFSIPSNPLLFFFSARKGQCLSSYLSTGTAPSDESMAEPAGTRVPSEKP